MVYLKNAFGLLAGLATLAGVSAAPVTNSTTADIVPRGTPRAPHFVVYTDSFTGTTGPPPVAQVKGYNVVALSFLLTQGAFDKATEWTQLSAAQRSSIKSHYAAAGIKLIVSAFGSTDAPTTNGADPIRTANTMAAWVKKYGLDGIDIDYEDFDAINAGNGKAEAWLASFTKQLRVHLPKGQYIISHAPVAPWFSPGRFGGGAYHKVHQTVGHLIDWYNVQFYNQNEYVTCSGLLTSSSSTWPESSVFQIAKNGVPLSKIVIGKPASPSGANNGYMSTSLLNSCVKQAKAKGWSK
ncbi:hypothetical protein DXG03_003977 [Asterophora parasitica]|uniref:GH18 domain-containing protein n=1 Tax=Asterophora parasitica TaxID=117018 RepID=A0A9P7KAH5_9AGAR|nr:hypothetical protein DXG03_003977 [Asterophora parasitica]